MKTEEKSPPFSRWVFWPAAIIVVLFVAFAMIAPDTAESTFAAIQSGIVKNFNWYYVLIAAFFVFFCLWIGFGKFGDIKLGKDDDEPEFSLGSWFSLLFAAGMGIGLVFYGVSEPLSHFANPRPGVTGDDVQLAQQAMSQTYLHWGVHAWAIYVIIGLALAYAIHRRGRPISIRWALEPVLGRHVRGAWGNIIDVIALVGTMFGVATSLGFGVLQIGAGLEHAGLFKSTDFTNVILIVIITGGVLFSVVSGVSKGMKWLSNFNLVLAALMVLVILAVGPTQFLLRDFVQSIGNYLQNFLGLTFNVSAFSGTAGEEWQAAWTTFYWGWWISWAPFVGIFIARISRGRTVREFITGVILVPTLITFLWFSVLGGTALYQALNGGGGLIGPGNTVDVEGALFQMLSNLPGGSILTVGAIVLIAIFFITSADSGALVMGMIATGGQAEPKRWIRVVFACASSLLAIALLLSGGLQALKTAAIIIALPFSVIMLGICWSTALAFKREIRAYERANRAAFVDHIGDYYGLEVEEPLNSGPLATFGARFLRRRRGLPSVQVSTPTNDVAAPAPADAGVTLDTSTIEIAVIAPAAAREDEGPADAGVTFTPGEDYPGSETERTERP
ncbi:BCCT family transporter [Mycetocola spongiae]|uniref:BCCT family transporter n=1 Tax=Mycetocola spongiae TaxID=2859226 RepID=UPI001CF27275|nr:BCCT family transporter [Mycetocola spongiae]UCR89826.1 BCCT family transporter [Mycetocola spongiae]